jgi:uncharacterized protein involved in outer membrane biogenesis
MLIAALAALPYLFPLSAFIPELERIIAQRIHQPVSIGKLRLFFLPLPYLRANAVTVGRNGLIEVDALTVQPSMLTLFSDTKVIREIELRGVRARFELLAAARALTKTEAAQRSQTSGEESSRVRVDRITLRDASIRFPSFTLSALSADVRLQNGKPAEIRATQLRDRLQITARRQGDAWNLDIFARDWKVPVGLPLELDRLEGAAVVTAAGLESKRLSGALYDGTFTGPVTVSWKSGYAVSGQLQIDGVELEPLVALFKREVGMTGKLSATASFSTQAREPAELINALSLESDFAVQRGVLRKVDLVAAAKNPLSRQAGSGGKTEFDELKGHLLLENRTYEFTDLHIGSGLFKAQGEVTVHEDKKLSGLIRPELKGTGSLISMPLDVSGTTQDPTVFPTRGAMAGAVAGTVLMPGLGTAVGMKAGELTERLFGRKKPAKRQHDAPK